MIHLIQIDEMIKCIGLGSALYIITAVIEL